MCPLPLKAPAETGVPAVHMLYIYIVGAKQALQAMVGGGIVTLQKS